jgi:SAM-dependent methyltransferase
MEDSNNIVLLENVGCILGCANNDEVVFSARDLLHFLPGVYCVVRCRACGLMRTNPRPTQATIALYYPDNYGPYLASTVNSVNQNDSTLRSFLKLIFNRVFNFGGTLLPTLKPGRLLEIGCASGAFLHQMATKGWRVHGIEFSEKAAFAAKSLGYSVHAGALEKAPQPEDSFDLIVGWMVLEHLHDPVAALKKLREWAKPESWLVLSIPNAGSVEFRLFRDKGYALQLPTHLYHFNPKSVEKVLLAGGWRLVKIHHQITVSNLVGSIGYVLRDWGYTKIAKRFIDFPDRGGYLAYVLYPFSWLLSRFGQTGRMTVWAKRL